MEALKALVLEREVSLAVSAKGLLRKVPPKRLLREVYVYAVSGEVLDRDAFLERLVSFGYERASVVRLPGEFAVRGGVVDVWPCGYELPVRIELLGDVAERIRSFDPVTQRSVEDLEEVSVFPVKEVFLTREVEEVLEGFYERASLRKVSRSRLLEAEDAVRSGRFLEPEEFWIPIAFERPSSLFDYMGQELFVIYEPEAFLDQVGRYWERILAGAKRAEAGLLVDPEESFLTQEEVAEVLRNKEFRLEAYELPVSGADFVAPFKELEEVLEGASLEGKEVVRGLLSKGEHVVVGVSDSRVARLIERFVREELTEEVRVTEGPFLEPSYEVACEVVLRDLPRGLFVPELSLALVSGSLFAKKRTVRRRAVRRTGISSFEELKPGDFVVHRDHGIGIYRGLVRLEVGGVPGEFLLVEYADGDKLYLPVDRLGDLHPYIGVDDTPPKLDKLGAKAFSARKERVKRAIQEVAQELVRLYAERKVARGHSFSPPDEVFRRFEESFPYEETPDQEAAIEEVLSDMQSPRPMDRLLAGDVGYGKTEVALRATMLAVRDGKQVAVLVPTTVLAEQHFRTFSERLDPFGVRVRVLSRLRPASEQRETLRALERGEVDVVIGTHRLLSPDVRFKDLGLLIVDEEHRFGVRHKERLKELKKTVDVLALSATPIPRTLQLSLLGVRDLSVIETPPPGRLPVKTVVAKMDPDVVREAVRRELKRGGQVFFVFPRIKGLYAMASWIKRLVPEARVEVAHGRMPPRQLEEVMTRFVRREVDVLVCTTIVESGLDIPTANTIIVARADKFGLSEIYQLRGRVGRSSVQAYAYLLVPSLSAISEDAKKRLQALLRFSELGSGFKLALSDLKIRGAGNLLGTSQSGHIAAVGYDLYLEILERAIRELKGETVEDVPEPDVKLKVPAYFPEEYVPDVEQRLHLYRELALVRDEEELREYEESLRDRFGEPPQEARNLVELTRLKLYLKELKVVKLERRDPYLFFYFQEEVPSGKILRRLAAEFPDVRAVGRNKLRISFEEDPLRCATRFADSLRSKKR